MRWVPSVRTTPSAPPPLTRKRGAPLSSTAADQPGSQVSVTTSRPGPSARETVHDPDPHQAEGRRARHGLEAEAVQRVARGQTEDGQVVMAFEGGARDGKALRDPGPLVAHPALHVGPIECPLRG